MSDEVALPDEEDDEAEAAVVDALNDAYVHSDQIRDTDELDNLDDVHAQAAANRRAMAPIGDDPTIITAGTEGIPPPGPGPEPEDLGIPPDLATLNPEPNPEGPVLAAERREANAQLVAHTAGEEYESPEEVEAVDDDESAYDPGAYTVQEVNDYIEEHPDEAEAIWAAEAAGKNRAGIVG